MRKTRFASCDVLRQRMQSVNKVVFSLFSIYLLNWSDAYNTIDLTIYYQQKPAVTIATKFPNCLLNYVLNYQFKSHFSYKLVSLLTVAREIYDGTVVVTVALLLLIYSALSFWLFVPDK